MSARQMRTLLQLRTSKVHSSDKYLYNVDNEYNGVITEAALPINSFSVEKAPEGMLLAAQFFRNSANSYGYRYEYKKFQQGTVSRYTRNFKLEIYLRYNDEQDKELFGFEEVSEYFSGRD